MIDFTEISDGDVWEEFCRDYLVALGLVVDIPPGVGPDGGRDLLVKEQLKGTLATKSFTWLVSCKHYASSGRSVGIADEQNIRDRLEQHGAEGFIGFYSTTPSSALITRLKELRDQKRIQSFDIFSAQKIEAGFHDIGLSGVLQQYLPNTHTALRPIHPLLGTYQPLRCDVCDADLLKGSVDGSAIGNVVFARKKIEFGADCSRTESVHFVCKGECDKQLEEKLWRRGYVTGWEDISDYCNPIVFLRRLTGYTNQMRNTPDSFVEEAHDRYMQFFLAVSQRTLRQTNEDDREVFSNAVLLDEIGA